MVLVNFFHRLNSSEFTLVYFYSDKYAGFQFCRSFVDGCLNVAFPIAHWKVGSGDPNE